MKKKTIGALFVLSICLGGLLYLADMNKKGVVGEFYSECMEMTLEKHGQAFVGYSYLQYLNLDEDHNYYLVTYIYKGKICQKGHGENVISYSDNGKFGNGTLLESYKGEGSIGSGPKYSGLTIHKSSVQMEWKSLLEKACKTTFKIEKEKNMTNAICSDSSLVTQSFNSYPYELMSGLKYDGKKMSLSRPVSFFSLGTITVYDGEHYDDEGYRQKINTEINFTKQ
ncbi:MAG: hypothetical protein K2Q18_06150 [Bdellovibrionales bacterium]|nr:hypothetical protein [Bdellovibrionales bacterium]